MLHKVFLIIPLCKQKHPNATTFDTEHPPDDHDCIHYVGHIVLLPFKGRGSRISITIFTSYSLLSPDTDKKKRNSHGVKSSIYLKLYF